jgi:L,D-transpeptidase ErfK/SrfK
MGILNRPLALLCFSCAILSGCSGVQESLVEVPAIDDAYVTYVTGNPPLVSDRFLLDSPDQNMVGALQIVESRYEDTFVDIAWAYNLGFDELVEANPDIDPWLPGAGTRVVLPTQFILPDAPHEGIVINLASKRLFWYLPADIDGQRAVITFPIGIGLEGTATPIGITTITQKVRDPVWFVSRAIQAEYAAEGITLPRQVQPGPDNPLGRHALLLGMPSYLLHGTNRPAGVGMRVSHGCVRLFPENIEVLYNEVPVGETVTIVDQPWLITWHEGRLYMEAHQPLQDDVRDWQGMLPSLVAKAMSQVPFKVAAEPDLSRVTQVSSAGRGIPLPVLDGEPSDRKYLQSVMAVNNIVVLPPELPSQVAMQE